MGTVNSFLMETGKLYIEILSALKAPYFPYLSAVFPPRASGGTGNGTTNSGTRRR